MAECPARQRYVPKALVVQRGLDPNVRHREQVDAVRFAVPPGPHHVCVRAEPGRRSPGRTQCFAEHSPRRKNCRLLAADGYDGSPTDAPAIAVNGDSLVFGPFATDQLNVRMKRVDVTTVFGIHRIPENVALRFTRGSDRVIPSVDMMVQMSSFSGPATSWASNLRACARTLADRRVALVRLRQRCATSPLVQQAARRFLRNAFMFAMYSRRWAGPGTPYPVSTRETNRIVGRHKPVAESLVGMYKHVTSSGDVKLRETGEEADEADRTEDGKAIAMTEAHLLAAFNSIDGLVDANVRDFLVAHMVTGTPVPTTDGVPWPADETLWDVLFAAPHSVAQQQDNATCIRQVSKTLLFTCTLLASYVYKTPPQWMRYEGSVDEVQ